MAPRSANLQQAVNNGQLRELDRYLAETLCELHGIDDELILNTVALLNRANGDGHVCLELSQWAGATLFEQPELPGCGYPLPELDAWRDALTASPLISETGERPLVLDPAGRLYLSRYHDFEQRITAAIRSRWAMSPLAAQTEIRPVLDKYFRPAGNELDMQRVAAAIAMLQPLCIISGGPGTGKTTTVSRILAMVMELHGANPHIALAAPTGKATARLTESIQQAKAGLQGIADAAVLDAIPDEAMTIHRLLGTLPNRIEFKHHRDNPLHLDLLIVDEASMLDVPLMARLLDAIPLHCRLILLGDRDQLASVEAGSVFSDLCRRGQAVHYSSAMLQQLQQLGIDMAEAAGSDAMADSLAVLTRSHRFKADSGIGALAKAINLGDGPAALTACHDHVDVDLKTIAEAELPAALKRVAHAHYSKYLQAETAEQALFEFNRFRILCALREGAFGVDGVNRLIETGLVEGGQIQTGERYYHGRPVMVTRNDYQLKLFNGDIGLCLRDPESEHRIRVFFIDQKGKLRRILPSRMPDHETAYALTVHKSQGSEFEHCLVVLPEYDSPVLTRELVYTAVTRGKEKVDLWCGDEERLLLSIARHVERHSGLYAKLWGEH